jgi:nucleotide-binding universal stress UspA family protein
MTPVKIAQVAAPLRILVGVDFSRESLRALRASRALITRCGGSLIVLHVRPASDVRAAVVEERGDLLSRRGVRLRETIAAHYGKRLTALARRRGESWKILKGRAADQIVREAKRGHHLVAVGSRGRGGVSRLVLGSTVQELLRRSPISVLVVSR